MNAAAKAIHQNTLFNGRITEFSLSRNTILLIIFLGAILASALGIVILTNTERMRLNHLAELEMQGNRLKIQYSKLLLEEASLAAPARIAHLAKTQYNMREPHDQEINFLATQKT